MGSNSGKKEEETKEKNKRRKIRVDVMSEVLKSYMRMLSEPDREEGVKRKERRVIDADGHEDVADERQPSCPHLRGCSDFDQRYHYGRVASCNRSLQELHRHGRQRSNSQLTTKF
ncbi:hypothetical protein U1Q18_042721 [Sarracenia purpurea var. burkii]